MHLAFDICQGLGIAAAAGIRPFLPALVTGALAAGDIQIDFKGTDYSFLQGAPFLFALLAVTLIVVLGERWRRRAPERPVEVVTLGVSMAIGAILFAGALSQHEQTSWPGLVGGVLCAIVGAAATIPLLRRVRARLDSEAASATSMFADGAALAAAALSVLAPPVGPLILLALVWLAVSGRGRQQQKYAGLRVLR
jgi:MFS family permease